MHAAHLAVCSHYSFGYGVDAPASLARAAAERGIDALALTDREGLYGAVDFYRAALAAGVRPILGVWLVDGDTDPGCTVLARDWEGYRALCELVSERRCGRGDGLAVAAAAAPHLFCLAGTAEWLTRLDRPALREAGSLYLRRSPADLCRDRSTLARRERLARLARQRGILPAASGEAAFSAPDAHEAHRTAVAMATGTTLARLAEERHAPAGAWLRDAERWRATFVREPEAVDNALRIAAACDPEPLAGELDVLHPPPFPLPAGTSAAEQLHGECQHGLVARYGEPVPGAAHERLQRELAVITDMGYATYFLVVHDLVREAERRGIPVLGRGSVANSLVAYALGITHVDPLAHDLFFERFLNPERRDPPDIDVDLPWDRRDEMVDYIYQRYGAERVAMVGAFATYEARGLVQEVGAALGVPRPQLARLTRRLPHVPLRRLPEALREYPPAAGLDPEREPLATVLRIGRYLDGNPKGLATHPCGIAVAPEPIARRAPLERSPKGLVTTQYSMYPAEALGLIKLDLLGNRSLTALEDARAAVRAHTGNAPDFTTLAPDADPATRELVARGDTMGCFYIESPSMRQVQARLDCRDFATLVAASSIIRPGVSHSGVMERYIRRHRGEEDVTYPLPVLGEILTETYGVMIYQEDVIRVVDAVAGMGLGEADNLRRAMSKKRDQSGMDTYRGRFVQGARQRGIPQDVVEQLWREIDSFSGYAFCKAHSASFAQLSFQVAYLKAHHPAEFLAAVLANGGGYYNDQAYINEAKRQGVAVWPPHIHRSGWAHAALPPGPDKPRGAIRLGLQQIRKLSAEASEALLEEAGRRPFASLTDLAARIPLVKHDALEALAGSGALDGLAPSRRALFWELEGGQRGSGPARVTAELFPESTPSPPSNLTAEGDRERLAWEWQYLGACVTSHPLTLYRELLNPWREHLTPAVRLPQRNGQTVWITGWQVTQKLARTRTSGAPMCFVTLEDRTGLAECVLFPDAYRDSGRWLKGFGPFVARGQVRLEQGVVTVEVTWLRPADQESIAGHAS
jgi:error-prone DNA polymerase